MVVCQFFLENRCKFGERCRNEHPRGGAQRSLFGGPSQSWQSGGGGNRVTFRDSFGSSGQGGSFGSSGQGGSFGSSGQGGNSQYKWSSSPQSNSNNNTPGSDGNSSQQISTLDLVNSLPKEMETWEKTHMWPFSCIAVDKDLPSLPEFNDVSPEELRFEAYDAMKSGNMQPYTQRFQSLLNEFLNKRRHLQHMTMELKSKLMATVDEARKNTQIGSRTSSVFGSGQPTASVFGQSQVLSPGLFGQSGGASTTTGLFGQSGGTSSTTGLFGQSGGMSSTTGLFGQSGGMSSTTGLFGQSGGTSSTTGLFGQSGGMSSTTGLFGQSGGATSGTMGLFGQSGGTSGTTGLFGQSSGTSGSTGLFGQSGGTTSSTTGLFGKPATGTTFGGSFTSGSANTGNFGGSGPTLFGKPVGTGSVFGNQASSQANPFGAVNQSSPSTFSGQFNNQGQPPGLFGNGATTTTNQPSVNPFSSSSPAGQSLFGKPAAGLELTTNSPFHGSSPSAQPSAFGGQASTTLFGKPAPSQNLFGSAAPGETGGGLFGKAQSSASDGASSSSSLGLYTPLTELTEHEKAAFTAAAFELGKIPIRPPPKEMVN